ncbi:MAG: tRNA glutamyl-Q(34) synthetase GluQRS [Rhodospirillaceae bacterium]|jgi:glutamyl-Q tRNA(Asp) synthetase|nr:tRNA glutamyl-Q(34) synthetase GluQRS [Rhodospirillaceae bacterium]MBT6442319.1 tRNA glutamyl-Q(34) synthetase GluQRS [Alphaproteobacteria bacterium]
MVTSEVAPVITRFAPSPSGLLHVGHAYAATIASRAARDADNGRFLLRIEDIDIGRCRPEFETAIVEDLLWLGLQWEEPVRRQTDHMDDYAAALAQLKDADLLYRCFCTRAQIKAEIAGADRAPHGPEGPVYPGTCRQLGRVESDARKASGAPFALRLDMAAAIGRAGPLTWHDQTRGTITAEPNQFGDAVVARKDVPTSYHLSVTVDDHLQGVTLVTRGVDLFEATHLHRLLQALLGFGPPRYAHHPLLMGRDGKRLAKRDHPATLRAMRNAGVKADDLRAALASGDSERLHTLIDVAEGATDANHRP